MPACDFLCNIAFVIAVAVVVRLESCFVSRGRTSFCSILKISLVFCSHLLSIRWFSVFFVLAWTRYVKASKINAISSLGSQLGLVVLCSLLCASSMT